MTHLQRDWDGEAKHDAGGRATLLACAALPSSCISDQVCASMAHTSPASAAAPPICYQAQHNAVYQQVCTYRLSSGLGPWVCTITTSPTCIPKKERSCCAQ